MAYEYQTIEKKWREFWEKNEVFKTDDPKPGEKKFFALDMFPYPSGSGLHVGHPVGYIASDIVSRVKRMQGYKVLHPMGWDAFGLPAEQHAIKTGKHPAETTVENAAYYKKQMNLVGLSYDWSREFSTTDPGYYHWTQYIFLQLYNAWFDAKQQKARPISELEIPAEVEAEGKAAVAAYRDQQRLVYFDEIFVNWCEELKVVLANEEVKNGRSEQGFDVVRIPKRQCMMRISSFADRLLAGLDGLDWPESILEQQRNWIGRTRGAEIAFAVNDQELEIRVFTSRPETIFGVSYLAISPEYADIDALTTADNKAAVEAYRQQANTKSERERLASKEKTGCFTGSYATNPVTGETVPVWVTDYVLVDYGTGAVMGVPAHDSRDFEFANAFGLDIQQVFDAGDGSSLPMTDHGKMLAFSYADQDFEGLSTGKAKKAIINLFHKTGDGEIQTNYRMRDWVFSRQRYWGDPIPLIHWEDGTTTGVPEADLPVVLPEVKDYQPTEEGDSALAKATDWLNVTDPKTGMKGLRETNTMPQWAGSCWYPLRFMDPHNDKQLVAPEKEAAWNSVDFYIGGAEHAVLHLLYARFWYLAMHDLGVIQTAEPFPRLINQGMLGSYAFRNEGGFPVPVDEVKEQEDGTFVWEKTGETVQKSSAKMSKSLRNVVNPDQIVEDYGADTLRIYLMFMGPIEAARVWDIDSIRGPQRFLRRFWNYVTGGQETGVRNCIAEADESPELRFLIHNAIKKVNEGITRLSFNTSIAALMELLNKIEKQDISKWSLEAIVKLLYPMAPFICEELNTRLGHSGTIAYSAWPEFNPAYLELEVTEISLVVQINGKKRAVLEVPAELDQEGMKAFLVDSSVGKDYGIQADCRFIFIKQKGGQGKSMLVNVIVKG